MNIFVVDSCPIKSAQMLPDKHVVKMSLEACQMLSIVFSSWYFNWGQLPKADGTFYSTKRGVFKNHPCTQWVAAHYHHIAWLIAHGKALCDEYTLRYGKVHGCAVALDVAEQIFKEKTGLPLDVYQQVTDFIRVMPDEFRLDHSINTMQAYQNYIASKPWVPGNYRKNPERRPRWIPE